MTLEKRYYDNDGDGSWLTLQSLLGENLAPEDGVVDIHLFNDNYDPEQVVRLSASDVEHLIEDLKNLLPKPEAKFNISPSTIFPRNINNKNIDLSDPYPG